MVQLSWAITQKSLPLGVWDSAQRRKDLHVQSEETTKCRKAIIFQLKNKFKIYVCVIQVCSFNLKVSQLDIQT